MPIYTKLLLMYTQIFVALVFTLKLQLFVFYIFVFSYQQQTWKNCASSARFCVCMIENGLL